MSDQEPLSIADIEAFKAEYAPVSPEVLAELTKTAASIRGRNFAGRHPELGRKINCCICHQRHYEPQCKQNYAVDYIEEDQETGERKTIYRTAVQEGKRPTKKQVLGAAQFKGKRIKKHWNRRDLLFVERVRKILGDSFDLSADNAQLLLKAARTEAGRQLKEEGLGKIK
jgi:hypothetical protein